MYIIQTTSFTIPRGAIGPAIPIIGPARNMITLPGPGTPRRKQANGKIAFSEPYVDVAAGGVTIAMSTIVYDNQGNDIGVISAEVLVNSLQGLLDSGEGDLKSYLLDKSGLYITHEDINAVMKQDFFTESGLERYREAVLSGKPFSDMGSDVFIYSMEIPDAGWILVSTIPTATVFADVNSLLWQLIKISLIIMAGITLVAILFSRSFVKPLKALNLFSENLAKGNFSGYLPRLPDQRNSPAVPGF